MVAHVILKTYSLFTEAFSYAVPFPLQQRMQDGMLVRVPFRSRTEKGIVVDIVDSAPLPHYKEIIDIIGDAPVLFDYQIRTAKWTADYYVCPLYKAIDLFLPKYVWEEKQENWVERSYELSLGDTRPKGGKEKKVVSSITQKISIIDLRQKMPEVSMAYIVKLAEKGILHMQEGDIFPPYFKSYRLQDIAVVQEKGLKKLTAPQQGILDVLHHKGERTFLLHGVTGSGKTEIYLHMAYEQYKQGKQSLILVPEIALTPQLIAYFFRVFGKNISVVHSQLSDGERFTEWVRIKRKESFVIIGSRSALFYPFSHLGLIVMDEEHEWTYKNDQSPRYHTREVAKYLSSLLHIPLILGSATPDIESYEYAKRGEYILLELPDKIQHPHSA
jgi:primosomal protein N' (replication factor Y)